jgi:hypothetical protein
VFPVIPEIVEVPRSQCVGIPPRDEIFVRLEIPVKVQKMIRKMFKLTSSLALPITTTLYG